MKMGAKQRIGAFLIIFAMLMSLIPVNPTTVWASGRDANSSNIAQSVSVTQNGKTVTGGNLVLYGKDEGLKIRYNLFDLYPNDDGSNEAVGTGKNIYSDSRNNYEFKVPQGMKVKGNTSWPITADVNGVQMKIGQAVYNPSTNIISVSFQTENEDLYDGEYTAIFDTYFEYTAIIDDKEWKDGNNSSKKINFSANGKDYDFNLSYGGPEDKKPSTIKKGEPVNTGKTDEKGNPIFKWEVTVSEGNDLQGKGKIEDTMDSSLTYVAGSFIADGKRVNDSEVKINSAQNTLTYEFTPKGEGLVHTFIYETTLDKGSIVKHKADSYYIENKNNEVKARNSVVLKKVSDTEEVLTKPSISTATYVPDIRNDFTKKSDAVMEYDKENDKVKLTWKVTINTNNISMDNLTIHDKSVCKVKYGTIPTDKIPVYQVQAEALLRSGNSELSENSEKITLKNTPVNVTDDGVSKTYISEWSYTIPKACGVYEITYTATISNYKYYAKYNQESVSNVVGFDFDWEDGNTGLHKVTGPKVYKKKTTTPFATGSSIKKDGRKNADNSYTWTITSDGTKAMYDENVCLYEYIGGGRYNGNSNGVEQELFDTFDFASNITNVKIKNEKGLYLNTTPIVNLEEVESGVYKITIKDLEGTNLLINNYVTFDIKTKLKATEENKAKYETNKEYRAYNSVALHEDDDISYATKEVKSVNSVIEKYPQGYDYNTHELKWKIDINKSNLNITDAIVEDVMAVGEEKDTKIYLDEISKDTKITSDKTKIPHYEYDKDTHKFTIMFGNISTSQTIWVVSNLYGTDGNVAIRTREGEVKTLKNSLQEDIIVQNEAAFKSGKTPREKTGKKENKITSQLITKNGNTLGDYQAEYSIEINKNQLSWSKKTVLKDTLPVGIGFDRKSVRLYKAEILEDGSLRKTTDTIDFDIKYLGDEDSGESFEIILPFDSSNRDACILEYGVTGNPRKMDRTASVYDNKVSISGFSNDKVETKNSLKGEDFRGTGNATVVMNSLVKIIKYEKDTDKTLSGAEFLLKDSKGNEVDYKVTLENGICVFKNLIPGEEYTLVETVAPEGYDVAPDITFVAPEKGDIKYIANPIKVEDEKIDGGPHRDVEKPKDKPEKPEKKPVKKVEKPKRIPDNFSSQKRQPIPDDKDHELKTGDNSNIEFWFIIMSLSGAGIVLTSRRREKEYSDKEIKNKF